MKRSRIPALVALVVVCALALAPTADAGVDRAPLRVPTLAADGDWMSAFLSWLTERTRSFAGGLRAAVGATSSCADPNGAPAPCPAAAQPVPVQSSGDTSSCVDPDGNRVPCDS